MVSELWSQLQFFRPGWLDALQILIVAFLLFRVLLIIQRTRAMQILLGVLVIAVVYLLSQVLRLTLIEYLLETLIQYGAFAALVVFQPELRTALSRLGQSRLLRVMTSMPENQLIDEIVHAVTELARKKTGAIIALEREVGLDEYAQTGSRERVGVSASMLQTIFTPGTPLHDGAVIIVGAEIRAAGAILPLTQFAVTDKSLGTRHRAAIGLSEETDALVIVVSEETAKISVALRGRLERDIDSARLREILGGALPERPSALAPAPSRV
ncbi:MAG TPA: TIGR00159 family protein [Gemmatimonadetes bacterium]|nr:TIGR00159 family protein [Gemmatimonadota bacterium]